MNKLIFPALLICFFIWLSFTTFRESKAMHERGMVITGKVTGYRSGDMGSSCPVGIIIVQGKQAQVSTGKCSLRPPAIDSKFELLYDPTIQKVAPHHPSIPYYTWSIVYAGLAFLILFFYWPSKST